MGDGNGQNKHGVLVQKWVKQKGIPVKNATDF